VGARNLGWGIRLALACAAAAIVAVAGLAASASGSGSPPACYDPSIEVEHGEVGTIYAGCWDPEYDDLAFALTDGPDHGTLSGPGADKNFKYTPEADYVGSDEFSYTVSDGTSTVPVTVHISVVPARDDPPSCHAWSGYGAVEAGEDHPVYVSCHDDEGVKVAVRSSDGPDHGALSGPNEYGVWTYKAESGYQGPDTVAFIGNDGSQDSSVATATLEVVPARNDPPDCYSVWRSPPVGPPGYGDGPIEGGEKAHWWVQCSDDEGDALTPRLTDPPDHGSVEGSGASLSYTAGHGFTGTDGFKFVMNDGVNDSQEHSVSVDVRENRNDPPSCGTPPSRTVEQGDVAYVQPYCYDDEGAQLTYEVVNGPAHGTVTPHEWGGLKYAPDAGYTGGDELTVRVRDDVNSVDVPVELTVIASANDAPNCFIGWLGSGFGASVENNESQRFSANCFDDENDRVSLRVTQQPEHGTLTVDGEVLLYTPDSSYTGPDQFKARGFDGKAHGPESGMSFEVVAARDDPPNCLGYARGSFGPFGGVGKTEAGEINPVTVQCHDDEGAAVTPAVTDQPEHGTLTDDGLGYLLYEPDDGFLGRDEFKFKGSTPAGQESTEVTVPIDVVAAANDKPNCYSGAMKRVFGPGSSGYPVEGGETVWLGLGCFDDEGDPIAFEVTDGPDHGSVELVPDRPRRGGFGFDARISYTPEAGYTGADSVKVRASDGSNQSDEVVLSFTVGAASNDPPLCAWFAGFSVQPSGPTQVDMNTICGDEEGDPLEFEIVDPPAHGELEGPDANGLLTYTPDGDAAVRDDFTFRVRAGEHVTAKQKAQLAPNTFGASGCGFLGPIRLVEPGGSLTLGPADLCGGDTSGLKVRRWISPPSHGSLTVDSGGSITYTPEPGYSGPDAFDVGIDNGERIVSEARVKVQVGGPPNAAPACRDSSVHVLRDTVTPIPLPCSDADGDALTIRRAPGTGPTHGRIGAIDSDARRVSYEPFEGFLGEDLFEFTADDGLATSAPATARMIVVADGAGRDVAPGESVSTGDSASDADPLTAAVTSPVAGRVAVFEGAPADDAPNGYSFLGQQVSIQAPRATAEDPLKLVFEVAAALLPPDTDPSELVVFRNEAPVDACSGPAGHASPTPCVAGREVLPSGNLRLTIFTVEASRWNIGMGATAPDGGSGGGPTGGDGTGGSPTGGGPTGGDSGDGTPPTGPGPGPAPAPGDSAAPTVKLTVKKGQTLRSVLKSGLRIEARCSEACAGTATLTLDKTLAKKLRIPAQLGTAKVVLSAAGRKAIVVKLTRKARGALGRTRRATLQLSARAADPAGNAAAAKPLKLSLRR
jgi:large repetitive protein